MHVNKYGKPLKRQQKSNKIQMNPVEGRIQY